MPHPGLQSDLRSQLVTQLSLAQKSGPLPQTPLFPAVVSDNYVHEGRDNKPQQPRAHGLATLQSSAWTESWTKKKRMIMRRRGEKPLSEGAILGQNATFTEGDEMNRTVTFRRKSVTLMYLQDLEKREMVCKTTLRARATIQRTDELITRP